MDDDDDGAWMDQMSSLTVSGRTRSYANRPSMPSPAPPPEFRSRSVAASQSQTPTPHYLDKDQPTRQRSLQVHDSSSYYHRVHEEYSASPDPGASSPHQDGRQHYPHSSSMPEGALRAAAGAGGGRSHLAPPHHHRLELGGSSAAFYSLHRIPSGSSDEDDAYGSSSHVASATSKGLPEFIAAGGGKGIFKLPPRAAVRPDRPPCLEVRPRPLRETQAGTFLRAIACGPTQLWAAQESGVRVWNFDDFFSSWEDCFGTEGTEQPPPLRMQEQKAAPFRQSCVTSPTLCLVVDDASGMVWSGHRDGKVRCWAMDMLRRQQSFDSSASTSSNCGVAGPSTHFKEHLSWQAHRGPVFSMVFSSYGDLWTGSEGGNIKVWPWETLQKCLSLTADEKHLAALWIERSYVDLRSEVTSGGVCPLTSADVKFLVSDALRSRIWSGGSQSFALWNSQTNELLKVFGIDGQVETRIEHSASSESYLEDETNAKFVSPVKKNQGSVGFFQRSRNALMGAADAVRRVATKGGFGDDRKAEALTITMDGKIWMGCANGAILQWDGNGNRVQDFQYQSSSVQCLCTFGTQLWVGYVNGKVHILDLEGRHRGEWFAHKSPIISMAVGGNYVYTLANHGGVRGWSLISPCPLDSIIKSELTNRAASFTNRANIKVLVGTWNVGQERASHDSLINWVGCAAADADMVVIGLQEVEMGAGVLAMSMAKETVGLEGSANGSWWLDAIGRTLDEGTIFLRVGSRQLAGLVIAVWVRKILKKHIGDVDVGAVPCGFGRAVGNKGAVGLRMRVYDRIICFMNCHFAAHLEAVGKRNADFDHVFRSMTFSRQQNPMGVNPVPGVQLLTGSNTSGFPPEGGLPELSDADMVVFLGDLNYRLDGISYDDARDLISQRSFDWLREKDQLRAEMKDGKVFQGMREGIIKFPPTYKFERHQVGFSGYDSGEKKRIPAWCDRILYRDSRCEPPKEKEPCLIKFEDDDNEEECSLNCPVVSSILQYDACMDVTDSDHKPVRCLLAVDIARIDELLKRQSLGDLLLSNEKIRCLLEKLSCIPEMIVSTNNIILQNQDTYVIRISNRSEKNNAMFHIICEGMKDGLASDYHPRGAFGFPRWLEISPTVGIIGPGQIVEVCLRHEEHHTFQEYVDGIPHNSWCEDTKDKEAILVIRVTGRSSTNCKEHKVHLQHCSSSPRRTDSGGISKREQKNLLQRADFKQLSNSSLIDDLQYLHSP